MSIKGKPVSLPINKIKFTEDSNQPDLSKVKLMVCKSGEVPSHNMFIEKESLVMSEDSIKNKPLLCAYEVDDDGNKVDFKGHEMTYKIVRDGKGLELKIEYIEQPVGVIPESCNFAIEEIDGEEWITVDAYIFKEYCSDVVDILEDSDGEKSVSMEINILESYEDDNDGLLHITKFGFTGVTLLGVNHSPAIAGANIKTFTQSDTFAIQFSKMVERVNAIILEKEGGDKMKISRESIIEKFSILKGNEKFENIISNTNLSNEELEKQLFSLSANDLEKRIREKLNEIVYTRTDYWGDTYESQKYWMCDLLISENIVIVEDNENWYKHYGIPFELNGDVVTLKEENKKRYIRGDWRPFDEGSTEPEVNPVFSIIEEHNKLKAEESKVGFEKLSGDLNKTKSEFTDLQSDKALIDKEVFELREFKVNFEKTQKEEQVNNVIEKFEELKTVDGYEDVISTKFEIPLEELETKLKVFAFDNGVILGKSKKTFSKKESGIKIPVGEIDNEVTGDLYGGILDKHLHK
ncbi:MAG: hypothetical protein RSC24_06695 [Clostridium sp.]